MRKVGAKHQAHLAKKAAKGQNRWTEPRHKRWKRYIGLARKVLRLNSTDIKVPTDTELIAMQAHGKVPTDAELIAMQARGELPSDEGLAKQ